MFPENYIPKKATQQNGFLKKYPEYDGRGIKIAIIDSDVVDKSLPGMQKTSIGLPKIIYSLEKPMVTVDTSTIVERSGKNYFYINGLTGRRLILSSKWKNPSDKWHLGSISLKDLYDITKEYDGLDFNFKKKLINNTANYDFSSPTDKMIDCIVWFDGKKWRACIDNTFSNTWFSNLKDAKVLTNYNDEHKYAYLNNKLIYCVNIHDNGNSLQIMYPHHSHATAVAHVAAAYFPNGKPENDGSAPGAQIISANWQNLEKALFKCIELKVDIVNFSITFPFTYHSINTLKKMVEEHDIIITQSATNLGPFYFSIPKQYSIISDQIFTIGSVYTKEMKPVFGNLETLQSFHSTPTLIYLSGKGPLFSGARGVDFVAPGIVITNLPQWYLRKNDSYNGTSCAAPNVAGSIACLLSALKANSIPYSPAMIKMALSNTAFLPKGSDKLAFGNGIIQLNDAFEYIKKSVNYLPQKFIIPFTQYRPHQKGIIFVHSDRDNDIVKEYTFDINPAYNVSKWILKCISSDNNNFVTHCKIVTNNSFNVKVDTSILKEGSINYAEICGIDSLNPSTGPLFHLPITVIYTANANYFSDKIITLKPHPTTHFFVKKSVLKSQQCAIKITLLDDIEEIKRIALEYPKKGHNNISSTHIFEFTAKKKESTFVFDVEEYYADSIEICFYHKDITVMHLKMEINFTNLNLVKTQSK